MQILEYPYEVLRIVPSFRCNFNCPYCSCEKYQENLCRTELFVPEEVSPDVWVERLNTLKPLRLPLLIIFCAGEPTATKDFHKIVNCLDKSEWRTFVYTNLSMPQEIRKMPPRDNLWFYVSYHPIGITKERFLKNALWLKENYNVLDFHGVPHPGQIDMLKEDAAWMAERGVIVHINHPYLHVSKDSYSFYGEVGQLPKFKRRFANRVDGTPLRKVRCKTSFNHHTGGRAGLCYPVGPNGDIYTCWRYILNHSKEGILGNFFDDNFKFTDTYYDCSNYGDCNACAWDKNIVDVETGKQLDSDVIAWESIS